MNKKADGLLKSTNSQKFTEISMISKKTEILKPDGRKPDTLFLYFTVISGTLHLLQAATSYVWTSPAVVKLQSTDKDVNPLENPITTVEISCLIGIPQIAALAGLILLTKLGDVIGRKKTLLFSGFLMLLSNIGLAFSKRIFQMVLFTSLFQIFSFASYNILPQYITEICEDHNRAKYGCLMSLAVPLGQLLVFIVGSAYSIKIFTLVVTLPLIPFLLLFPFAPESPYYSLSKGKKQECIDSLKRLRNNKSLEEIEIDFGLIKNNLKTDQAINDRKDCLKIFSRKEYRIGLLFGSLPIIAQYMSGVGVIMSLLAPILNESGSNISGNTISIIVGSVKSLTYTYTSFVIQRFGRKMMLIVSSVGAGLSILVLGTFFYLKYLESMIIYQYQWIPLVSIILYIIFYSLGLGPIPLSMMSELFPSHIRSNCIMFISVITSIIFALYGAFYPILAETIGTHTCLFIFGASCFLSTLIFVLLPNTENSSIVEIQDMLKNFKWFK